MNSNQNAQVMTEQNLSPQSAAKVLEFLLKNGEKKAALRLAEVVTESFPNEPFAHFLLYQAQIHSNLFTEAAESIRRASVMAPEETKFYVHYSRALHAIGRADESESLLRRELRHRPDWNEAWFELARSLGLQGKYDEAEKILYGLLARAPDNAFCKHQLAWYLMHQGDLRKGQEFSVGLRDVHTWGARSLNLSRPIWDGKECKGLRLCLIGEGGFGDEIIGARFGKILQDRGARVSMVCKPEMLEVFRRVRFFDEVVSFADFDKLQFDAWLPCLDACAILGLDYADLPQEPFLSAHRYYQKKWQKKLPKASLRVGIRWQGSSEFEGEQMRRVPAELMFAWSQITGVQLFSLQKPLEGPLPKGIIDLGSDLETWDDTLAVMSELDLVITMCSSVAHASAALGRPTWVLAPLMPYYIWAEPGQKSSWYPTARIFRQQRYRYWDEPCKEVAQALSAMMKQRYR